MNKKQTKPQYQQSIKQTGATMDEQILMQGKLILDKYMLLNFDKVAAVNTVFADKPKSPGAAQMYFARMMQRPELQEYLRDKKERALRKNEADVDEVIAFLVAVVRVDILDAFNTDGTLKELDKMSDAARACIKTLQSQRKQPRDGRASPIIWSSIEFYSKMDAAEKLLKIWGSYGKDNEQKRDNKTVLNRPNILLSGSGGEKTAEAIKMEIYRKMREKDQNGV
jgi:Terminase small subunit